MQASGPTVNGRIGGHSRIMKMMLLEGRQERIWPRKPRLVDDQAPDLAWTKDEDGWSPRLRAGVFLTCALGSWALVLGAAYMISLVI